MSLHERSRAATAALVLLFSALSHSCGQIEPPPPDPDKDAFDAARAFEDLVALSSDSAGGRLPGTIGFATASALAERRLESLGFEVRRQEFKITVPVYDALPRLALVDKDGATVRELEWRKEFSDTSRGGAKGAFVETFALATPAAAESGEAGPFLMLGREHYDPILHDVAALDVRLWKAGTKALIHFVDPASPRRRAVDTAFSDPDTPAGFGFVKLAVADTLKEELLVHLESGGKLSVSQPVRFRRVDTWNVVAALRAEKPSDLPPVYLCARIDHVGTDPDGTVFNGALSGASGMAMALEIARAAAERREMTRRDLVVVLFSGEEGGSLGARLYAMSPPFPLRGSPLVFLDMVGARSTAETIVMYSGAQSPLNETIVRALRARFVPSDPVRSDRAAHSWLYRAGASAITLVEFAPGRREAGDDADVTVDRRRFDLVGGAVTEVVLSLLLASPD